MRKINCGLIVSDFDATLTDDSHSVPAHVKKAICEYVDSGGIFAVCTGRMLRSILPEVRAIGLKGLVVAYQGTVIADIESGKLIKSGGFDYISAREICRALEENGAYINVYSDNVLYTNIPKDNKYLIEYEKITGVEAEYVKGLMSDFVYSRKLFCQKTASLVSPKDRQSLYEKMRSALGGKYDVTCSAEVLVEVSPLNDNKGEAVKFLCSHYGVPIEKSVAIGDNLNDLSMITAAGTGVAVGNAVKALKDAADFVSVTNNEGGVAQIIEKYGFV